MLLALGAALAATAPGSAQVNSGGIGARASIQGPMTIFAIQDLSFGTVLPGTPSTVRPNQAAAGVFRITGVPNAFVNVSFTLPTVLDNIQAAPGITMPITFLANGARYRRRNPGLGGGTRFNPATGTVARLGGPARPNLYVYIGGRVIPSPTQLPGRYTGTITVNVFYP